MPDLRRFYAHTLDGGEWQSLVDHLQGVAARASEFSAVFSAQEWGRILGLWHDVGKFSRAFQTYLRSVGDTERASQIGRVDHSSAGAQHAVSQFPVLGQLLAYPIAGHHSGLLDALGNGAHQEARLKKQVEDFSDAPAALLEQAPPAVPEFLREAIARRDSFAVAFFARMIYSCLVDADFLDTEAFMSASRSDDRPTWPSDIVRRMASDLERYLERIRSDATEVVRWRSRVLDACLDAAARRVGFHTLTVPTGGGKTFSSLAFALKHAVHHDLRRVIYVAPFTSIIEQNAERFRDVMSGLCEAGIADPVVEHHSNIDRDVDTPEARLSTENWDAPLIVTTGVQFYESLFANRTSRCRKLHNIARSVVILDEAQAIPVDYLEPCLRALDQLQRNYGTSVVLCTATQPALGKRDSFSVGLDLRPEHEIIPDPPGLFDALKRTEVERAGQLDDEELAERILADDQALCIVNTRGHALRLAKLLGEQDGHIHLSGLMCPQHRSEWLDRIRDRLAAGDTCRVISTRLIEAGVDVDFPVVYRSMAGLDSIAQAAGRCNRNGRLPVGMVVVFEPEDRSAEQFMADTASAARQVLPLHADPLSLDSIEHYFRLYYWEQSDRWDRRGIVNEFHLANNRELPFQFGFATVGQKFRLIQDTGKPVIIPWRGRGEEICDQLRTAWNGFVPLTLRRQLQRYTVQIPERVWQRYRGRAFELVHEQYPVLANTDYYYSDLTGLTLEQDASELLIA